MLSTKIMTKIMVTHTRDGTTFQPADPKENRAAGYAVTQAIFKTETFGFPLRVISNGWLIRVQDMLRKMIRVAQSLMQMEVEFQQETTAHVLDATWMIALKDAYQSVRQLWSPCWLLLLPRTTRVNDAPFLQLKRVISCQAKFTKEHLRQFYRELTRR